MIGDWGLGIGDWGLGIRDWVGHRAQRLETGDWKLDREDLAGAKVAAGETRAS